MLAAVWPLASGLAANLIWTGECVFGREGNTKGGRECEQAYTRLHATYSQLSKQHVLNPFDVISKCVITHLTLFNSMQLGTVPLIALAPKYCSQNTAIDVVVSK